MIVSQSKTFAKQKKKLHLNQINALDVAVKEILKHPHIGEAKAGNLRGIRVYKFNLVKQECLLAYSVSEHYLNLLAMGAHENFYRELSKSLND
ncbi:hypothetical protein BH10PSE19_BH10PSE19_01960 [soil metagenome]